MLFNLNFASNTILSFFLFFFLIIDLYVVILGVIALIFNPNAELLIPIGRTSKKAKAEIEINSVTVEVKMRECSI